MLNLQSSKILEYKLDLLTIQKFTLPLHWQQQGTDCTVDSTSFITAVGWQQHHSNCEL